MLKIQYDRNIDSVKNYIKALKNFISEIICKAVAENSQNYDGITFIKR